MTIFDYLKDILIHKTGNMTLESYVPFLVNRWLSFINPEVCQAINILNNKTLLENKEMHYKTAISLFPKMKYLPKIVYIKKVKEKINNEENLKIKMLAQALELSEREVSQMLIS